MIKVDTEAFVRKSPFERLKILAKAPWAVVQLALSAIAVLAALFTAADDVGQLIVKTTDSFVLGHGTRGRIIDAQDKLSEALDNLAAVRDELKKSEPNTSLIDGSTQDAELSVSAALKTLKGLTRRKHSWDWGIVSYAYADSQQSGAVLPIDVKRWLLLGVMTVLAGAFILSIVAIFRTKDAQVLQFAFDMVKTLMGFFIGVATTLIGTA